MNLLKSAILALAASGLAVGLIAVAEPGFQAVAATEPANPATLQPVSAFAAIKDKNARAVALFEEAGKVIQSPRCMNCHPATERPTQTDRMLPHQPLVISAMAAWVRRVASCAAPATTRPISIRPACPAIRNGRWPPRRWPGRASR